MQRGICRLCELHRDLEESHILPKFVIRWQNDTAVGPLREAERPNIRIQDGTKLPFLCSECEDLFASWETPFAAKIFAPLHRPVIPSNANYGSWCLKFAVSVSWRVLRYWSEDPRFSGLSDDKKTLVERALTCWREFLLDRKEHPSEFEQHVLPLSSVEQTIPGLSARFNRYVMRAVDHVFAHSSQIMYVYSKLGRLVLFGMLPADGHVPGWRNTKLHVKRGTLQFRDTLVEVPEEIFHFMSDRADWAARALASMSPRQKVKVEAAQARALRDSPDGEFFQALLRDYELFGDQALAPPEDE
jgi:hypothetical protein